MANSRETSGYEYGDSVAGFSCFRWFCCGREGDSHDHNFLLQERGKEETVFVLVKLKNFTSKTEEYLCRHMKFTHKRRHNQFHYSAETYALNFASEHEQDEYGDLSHSFSSRFASIDDRQRRMASL